MTALEKASYYLSIKPRTKKQIYDYLTSKGFKDEEISSAILALEEYHYIDDVQFARMFFELGYEKGRGESRIRRELAEKGVSKDDIEDAFLSLDEMPDEREMALEIGKSVISRMTEDMISTMDYKEKQKLQAKIARKLASRGYKPDVVYSVSKELVK